MKSLELAKRHAKTRDAIEGKEHIVVFSPCEFDIDGNDYHVTTEYEADTFFCGCKILFSSRD